MILFQDSYRAATSVFCRVSQNDHNQTTTLLASPTIKLIVEDSTRMRSLGNETIRTPVMIKVASNPINAIAKSRSNIATINTNQRRESRTSTTHAADDARAFR